MNNSTHRSNNKRKKRKSKYIQPRRAPSEIRYERNVQYFIEKSEEDEEEDY